MDEVRIERLGWSDRKEVLNLFTQAFAEHPLIPAIGGRTENTQSVLKAFLDLFGKTKSAQLYGIRRNDKLVCASLSVDSAEEPPVFALLRFIFALSRAMGWRAAKELEAVHKEEPKYEERYLELIILGTLPAYQRQGLGRKMLRFLYETAEQQGFQGVILVADRDTPAFHLYQEEGFKVDKEFMAGETTLCWMRYVIAKS